MILIHIFCMWPTSNTQHETRLRRRLTGNLRACTKPGAVHRRSRLATIKRRDVNYFVVFSARRLRRLSLRPFIEQNRKHLV